jgi:hypothetical protein
MNDDWFANVLKISMTLGIVLLWAALFCVLYKEATRPTTPVSLKCVCEK